MRSRTHPLGPMHPCLNVDEIIRLIARELVTSNANATAVALACCRKDFEDPVLDTLWETQGNLVSLLGVLPGDVWDGSGHNVSVPITPISPHLQPPGLEATQKIPDDARTDSAPEILSEDARAQREWSCTGDAVPKDLPDFAALRRRWTIISAFENS